MYFGDDQFERFFCRIKHFRRVATRYDQLGARFASFVALTATISVGMIANRPWRRRRSAMWVVGCPASGLLRSLSTDPAGSARAMTHSQPATSPRWVNPAARPQTPKQFACRADRPPTMEKLHVA